MTTPPKKRDAEGLESRRLEGVRLLKEGMSQSSVARQLQVSRQAVHQWASQLQAGPGGEQQLKAKGFGRPARLSEAQREELRQCLQGGPRAAGLPFDSWTIQRVCTLIQRRFDVEYSGPGCWGLLSRLNVSLQNCNTSDARDGSEQRSSASVNSRPSPHASSFDYVVRTLSERGHTPLEAWQQQLAVK